MDLLSGGYVMSKYRVGIIGCGGIGCALVPIISKWSDTVLLDADDYEPGNASRQFPALKSTGNKAEVLASTLREHTMFDIICIKEYLQGMSIYNNPDWDGVDMIVGCVDNNTSRIAIINVAEDMGIPAILAGNEHEHGEAHMFLPGVYNPLEHFPFPENEPAPWSCNSDETLAEHPQTAIANALAASATIHLLLSWEVVIKPHNAVVYSRLDSLSSSFHRAKHLLSAATLPS
jgi:molybdopterin/thiamine biosynthesis adenylyltransferase